MRSSKGLRLVREVVILPVRLALLAVFAALTLLTLTHWIVRALGVKRLAYWQQPGISLRKERK